MTDDDMSNDADHLIDRSARLLDHEVSRIDRSLRDRMSSAVEMQAIVSSQARRRELELQLQKIRSEALAARLDAKAAEIELMIRRLSAESPVTESASPPSEPRQPS